jgi:ABC-type nitrate/sulfonate/bicarbonate transport system substrate-binding protein
MLMESRNDYDTFGTSFVSSYLHLCVNSRNQLTMKANATLQLSGRHNAQFAGYYAANSQGYFKDECLTLIINVTKESNYS